MESIPDYKKTIDLSPVDPEANPWDNGTLYASAVAVMRQEYKHNLNSVNIKIMPEARRAHKFVSMNLTDAATNILLLSGDQLNNVQNAVIEIRQMIRKEELKRNSSE